MTEFGQGLSLSGIGILVTFSALGLLILLILLLKWVFPARENEPFTGKEMDPRESLKEQAAAAAVAALLDQQSSVQNRGLGALLERPTTNWWKRGVDRVQGKEIK